MKRYDVMFEQGSQEPSEGLRTVREHLNVSGLAEARSLARQWVQGGRHRQATLVGVDSELSEYWALDIDGVLFSEEA